MKAVKFGGTSVATAESILRVVKIIKSDAQRRFVVVSAPGKASGEEKVTDMLVGVYNAQPRTRRRAFAAVRQRLESICDGVGLGSRFLNAEFENIECGLDYATRDYIISRGEYLCAKILSALTGYEFIDGATLIRFNGNTYDDECTETLCKAGLAGKRSAIISGFYGSNGNGEIVTFSRGGSDITGAIVARAIGAEVYENFTDVDGFMTCDPRFVPQASVIDVITYRELRELSYMGANVLHPDSVFPVKKANIPIHILNTFNPSATGTRIVPTEEFLSGKHSRIRNLPITAIAGKQHFFSLHIDKSMMNGEIGIMRRTLSCFERLNISVEHVPTGIDSITVIFSAVDADTSDNLIECVRKEVNPDSMSLCKDLSLIAIVGHGMKSRAGTAAKALNKLSNAGINLRMVDSGASEINLILGVSDGDFERALIALTGEFEA